MNSFYNNEELKQLGLKSYGKNVLISKKCSIYGAENISIGNNVRIDDFCTLSGKIEIGNYVHIASYSALYAGTEGIIINDFVSISARCTIWGKSDDYSGLNMTNPTIPDKYKNVKEGKIVFEKHSILGCNTVVMPDVTIAQGTATGVFSFIKKSTKPWMTYFGIPARAFKQREQKILELEKEFLESIKNDG